LLQTYEIPKNKGILKKFILNSKNGGKKLEFQKKSYEIPNSEGKNWNL